MKIGKALTLTVYAVFLQHAIEAQKINGVSFVAPEVKPEGNFVLSVKTVEANYIAFNPYGFSKMGKPMVFYNSPRQWWGETVDGTHHCVRMAREANLNVMLKPHIWTNEHGWPAEYDLKDDSTWVKWEKNYRAFIMAYVDIAVKEKVSIFCIGTEYRTAALKREKFWRQLIADIRKVYTGKITYAANWDDYQLITFWGDLDYIGIDAYFPLSEESTPSFDSLARSWLKYKYDVENFAARYHRQVLFTEFGYRSIDKCAGRQWLLPDDYQYKGNANMTAQLNAYAVMFATWWKCDFFAGGFLWKWYGEEEAGGADNNDYTPQQKVSASLIKKIYSQYK